VLGPNINVPMDPTANAPALTALERAKALAGQVSDEEQALTAALAKRYSADPNGEGVGRDGGKARIWPRLNKSSRQDE
jgi:hypothetical protein